MVRRLVVASMAYIDVEEQKYHFRFFAIEALDEPPRECDCLRWFCTDLSYVTVHEKLCTGKYGKFANFQYFLVHKNALKSS